MLPERAQLVLSTHIPQRDLHIAELQGLHVEPDGGDGGHKLALLQLAQQRGLSRPVQAQDNNPHLNLGGGRGGLS